MPDGPWKYDPNGFGTTDFLRLCRLVGGPPYIAANLRSLPARDFYQWVEYCNSPAGFDHACRHARRRRRSRAFNVGTGASATSRGVAAATSLRRNTLPSTALHGLGSPIRRRTGVHRLGPNGGDLGWTRRFFTKLIEKGERQSEPVVGMGAPSLFVERQPRRHDRLVRGKGDAVQFSTDEWYELLNEADRLDGLTTATSWCGWSTTSVANHTLTSAST